MTEYSSGQATERELVMLKVKATAGQRSEVMQVCDIFRAKIIDVAPDTVNMK